MNYHFELTNTIPLPKTGRAGRYAKYPFRVMKPGDSFFVKNGIKSTVYQAARKASERLGDRRFVVQSAFERDVPGVRVWRSE